MSNWQYNNGITVLKTGMGSGPRENYVSFSVRARRTNGTYEVAMGPTTSTSVRSLTLFELPVQDCMPTKMTEERTRFQNEICTYLQSASGSNDLIAGVIGIGSSTPRNMDDVLNSLVAEMGKLERPRSSRKLAATAAILGGLLGAGAAAYVSNEYVAGPLRNDRDYCEVVVDGAQSDLGVTGRLSDQTQKMMREFSERKKP